MLLHIDQCKTFGSLVTPECLWRVKFHDLDGCQLLCVALRIKLSWVLPRLNAKTVGIGSSTKVTLSKGVLAEHGWKLHITLIYRLLCSNAAI